MWKLFEKLADLLFDIPRYHNDDGSQNANYPIDAAQWRRTMAGMLVLSMIGQVLAWTAIVWLFLAAARADDVSDVKAQLIAEKIEQVSTTICMAEPGTVDVQLREYQQQLQESYRDLTGAYYQAPSCEILLKLQR